MRSGTERGAALLIALVALGLVSAIGLSLLLVTDTEMRVAGYYSESREAMYAAEGALEIAAHELVAVGDWNALLGGGVLSRFVDGAPAGNRQLSDGSTLSLTDATLAANSESRPWGANNPQWRLFAFGRLSPAVYVVAWAADDPAENDGNPLRDGEGVANPGSNVLMIRAEAFGARGSRKVLEAVVRRVVGSTGRSRYPHAVMGRGAVMVPLARFLLAICAAWPRPAATQSLADVARVEEARRKAVKAPSKVYTNDSLRAEDGGAPPAPRAAADSTASGTPAAGTKPATASPPAPAAATDSSKDEKYWRERIAHARSELKRSQAFYEALQSQINGLYTQFVNMDDPAQRALIEKKRLAAIAEQDRVKTEIATQNKAITDIEDEARRANVPAGWLR